jgi:predicted transposase YdaD
MSRKDKAIVFFKRYLPASVLDIADLSKLELVESKHISDEGLTLYNDVLYKCPLEGNQIGYFFGVCEHQSTPEDQMPLRLLKYDLSIIEDHLKHNSHFPVVINTVLYHGKAPWNYSTAFVDYYSNPTLGGQFLYMAPFTLINIPAQSVEAIYQDKELGFCFLAFQCTSTVDPYQSFAKAMQSPIFAPYFKSLPKEEKNIFLRYLGQCINRKQYSLENLVNLVTDNNQEKEELMHSIAQPYIEQGIQQGIEQGIQTEKMYIAKSMLKDKEPMEKVIKYTGLSAEAIEKLKQE